MARPCEEYLESIVVPRVNALQVLAKASEWFEFEQAKNGRPTDAPFGVDEMDDVVEFLKEQGVSSSAGPYSVGTGTLVR